MKMFSSLLQYAEAAGLLTFILLCVFIWKASAWKKGVDNFMSSLEPLRENVKLLVSNIGKTDILDRKTDVLDKKTDVLDRRIDGLDRKTDALDRKIDVLDKKTDALDRKIDGLDKKIDILYETLISKNMLQTNSPIGLNDYTPPHP